MKEFKVKFTTLITVPFATEQIISVPEEFLSQYDEDDYEQAVEDYIRENEIVSEFVRESIETEISQDRTHAEVFTEAGCWEINGAELQDEWEIGDIEEWD